MSKRYICDFASPSDEPELCKLACIPMQGKLPMSLFMHPSRQDGLAVQGDRLSTAVVRNANTNEIVCMGVRTVRKLWINGDISRVGYLSGLRVKPGIRLTRRVLSEFYTRINLQQRVDEVSFDLTSIMADNHRAKRLLLRNVAGMPTYHKIGEMVTCTLPICRTKRFPHGVVRLDVRWLEQVVGLLQKVGAMYQMRPFVNEAILASSTLSRNLCLNNFVGLEIKGKLVACAALWDQRAYKQAVITQLPRNFQRWQSYINWGCQCIGRTPIPQSEQHIQMVYASCIALSEQRRDWGKKLIAALRMLAFEHNAKMLVLGLPAGHELLNTRLLRQKAWKCRSLICRVSYEKLPELESRPVWPEIAVL
ncbi:hypothetical protein JD969_17880 [Planctomycetota bacterium]|nr:hypothetical protein JD969_17880 [Planctomycetota bacterium]